MNYDIEFFTFYFYMLKLNLYVIIEAKQTLIDAIQKLRDTVQDPEKVQGRLNRDDKVCT